ncbi:MAG: hypothetical protein CMN21_01625 [Rubinisphaera sp.]|uniref:Spy/CpxP family protein refolding chaperone n=1 Tax=Rubinisphaera sp. TaxID=2024857 RepID=UPI000C115C7E|nr:periplasmic heavy metal sensor [Rubinisphaera sp.]MBV07899.1 hypothetical protein [Rubinisphaera sp.]|tara:strand:- start:2068 stop:2901 length:834 start_codon:yes stop_codon:yes gene_type:complete
MNIQKRYLTAVLLVICSLCSVLSSGKETFAQQRPRVNSIQHNDPNIVNGEDLALELKKLREQVGRLEQLLNTQHQSQYPQSQQSQSDSLPMKGMEMMSEQKGMSGMGPATSMQAMPSMGRGMMSGKGGMGMMSAENGMGMMGRNPTMSKSMPGMTMPSALPGFPGASHLYHIGETSFFLDHPDHITLTPQQQLKLNGIKEAALLSTATAERAVAEAEQDLWKLTAAAEPDINMIEDKAQQIAQLRVQNRIAFIRSVGEAAKILTPEQRETLVGRGMQ